MIHQGTPKTPFTLSLVREPVRRFFDVTTYVSTKEKGTSPSSVFVPKIKGRDSIRLIPLSYCTYFTLTRIMGKVTPKEVETRDDPVTLKN